MKDKNKKLLIIFGIVFLLVILLIACSLLFKKFANKPGINNKPNSTDQIIGFGSAGDEEVAVPSDNLPASFVGQGDKESEGSSDMPTAKDRPYTYTSKSGKTFDIIIKPNVFDNELVIEGKKVNVTGVAHGKWSEDESFIMFSKFEGDRNGDLVDIVDSGNIWVVNADGKNIHKVYELGTIDIVDYVSNGTKIGFVTTNKVGTVDKSGDNVKVLKDFEPINMNFPTTPNIFIVGQEKFQVTFPGGNEEFGF